MTVTYERLGELVLAPRAPSGSQTLDAHLTKRPEKYLYHYTSADGLMGIMKSRTLFATNIMFMNDLTEIDHALEQVVDLQWTQPDRRRFLDVVAITMRSAARRRYVSALSARWNSLSQWRGYCPGGGYSIGIPSKQLHLMTSEQGYTLCQCIYDDSEKQKILTELVDTHQQRFDNLIREGRLEDDAVEQIQWEFAQCMVRFGPIIKHSAFGDEFEWRLISPSIDEGSQMEFRSRRGLLTPYLRFQLSRDENDNWTRKGSDDHLFVTVGPTSSERERDAAAFALQCYATSLNWTIGMNQSNILFDDIR